jgi:colicin import membrane protein
MRNPVFAGFPGDDAPENRSGLLILYVGVSVLLHLMLVAFVLAAPHLFRRTPVVSPGAVITVDMVSLPEPTAPEVPLATAENAAVPAPETPAVPLAEEYPPPEPAPPKPAPEEPVAPEPPPILERVVVEDAPEPPPPAPAVKRPDPRTKKPPQIAPSIAPPAVDPEPARAEAIQKAIGRVRQKVNRTASVSRSGESRRGPAATQVSDIYLAQVRYRVEQNWAFSGAISHLETMKTEVTVRVGADGGIRDVWFQRRSGNTLLDDSAYRAVMKSNPLPPLPDGFSQYEFTFGFTPSGLN